MSDRRPAKRSPNPGHGGPARRYSWPPFEPGNLAGLKHGAQSDRLVEPRARELLAAILEANPHLDATRDAAATFRYCVALSRIERCYVWLAEQGDPVFADVDAGEVHAVYHRLERWERQAEVAEDKLAISPLTRARLGLDTLRAAALSEEERAEARAARERLDNRLDAIDTDAEEVEDDG
jgi:hypothetical protein